MSGSTNFLVRKVYKIHVGAVSNCNLALLPSETEAGNVIDLRLGCKFGYEVSAARVTLADGTEVPMNGLTFVMPESEVYIELTVTQIVYRVTFVADGVVLDVREYLLGDEIVIPEAPFKASDAMYEYTFVGWSDDITIAIGDVREPVYEAVYIATPLNTEDPYQSGHNNNVFLSVVLPIVLSVLGVAAVAVTVYILYKKRVIKFLPFAKKPTVSRVRLKTVIIHHPPKKDDQ